MISRFMENVKQTVIIKLQIIERGLNRVGASYRGGLTSNFLLIRRLNIERGLNRVGASYRGGLTSNFFLIRELNIERGLKRERG